MKKNVIAFLLVLISFDLMAQKEIDSAKLEKIRAQSGVDPTRVQTRVSYSFLLYNQPGGTGQINNQFSANIGVGRWSFASKFQAVSMVSKNPGAGFNSGFGDIRFSMLNAFYVKGKNALAGAAEINMPTGKPGFGTQYLSLTPSLTFSHTIQPSLIFAIQPQYTFALMKDVSYPKLSVLTVRSFLAKFTNSGYFFVFEPRPVYDFTNEKFNLIISPILGRALGRGFNVLLLAEFPMNKSNSNPPTNLIQFGFNKSF